MPTLTDTTCLILDVVVFFSFRDVEYIFFLAVSASIRDSAALSYISDWA